MSRQGAVPGGGGVIGNKGILDRVQKKEPRKCINWLILTWWSSGPALSECPGWPLSRQYRQRLHRSHRRGPWCQTETGHQSWSPSGGPQKSGWLQDGSEGPKPASEPVLNTIHRIHSKFTLESYKTRLRSVICRINRKCLLSPSSLAQYLGAVATSSGDIIIPNVCTCASDAFAGCWIVQWFDTAA